MDSSLISAAWTAFATLRIYLGAGFPIRPNSIQVGDEIDVKILKYDQESDRVSLGIKQLSPRSMGHGNRALSRVGSKTVGKVVSITDYGVFVELEEGR